MTNVVGGGTFKQLCIMNSWAIYQHQRHYVKRHSGRLQSDITCHVASLAGTLKEHRKPVGRPPHFPRPSTRCVHSGCQENTTELTSRRLLVLKTYLTWCSGNVLIPGMAQGMCWGLRMPQQTSSKSAEPGSCSKHT